MRAFCFNWTKKFENSKEWEQKTRTQTFSTLFQYVLDGFLNVYWAKGKQQTKNINYRKGSIRQRKEDQPTLISFMRIIIFMCVRFYKFVYGENKKSFQQHKIYFMFVVYKSI